MHLPTFSHSYPLALDLGSAWTRAVSASGRRFCSRSERRGLKAVHGGAIVEGEPITEILHDVFETLRPRFSSAPHVAACISSCVSEKERALYTSTLYRSGASNVTLVPQALAAALGAGLDPASDYAQLIVDIGDSFTEYAVLRAGQVEISQAVEFGCGGMREAFFESGPISSRGDDLMRWWNGTKPFAPECVEERDEALSALDEPFSLLAETLLGFFRDLPDKMACEVIENGVVLVGGGALLRGVRGRLSARTGLLVRVPPNPLTAMIDGAAQVLPYLN